MHELFGMKVDASGLLLSSELKFQISNSIENGIDFALLNATGKACIFLDSKYMVTVNGNEFSFTFLPNKDALMNAVSLCVAGYREYKELGELLSSGDIKTVKETAYFKSCLVS